MGVGGFLTTVNYNITFPQTLFYFLQDQDFCDDLPDFENDAAEKIDGYRPTFLKESVLPSTVFSTPRWNLVDAAMRLQRIFIEHKIEKQVNRHALRIAPADFCAGFIDKQPL